MNRIKSAVRHYLKNADLLLLGLALVASCFGLVLVFSATRSFGTSKFVLVQGSAIALGAVGFVLASLVDYERLGTFWRVVFVLNLLLQASTYFLGESGDSGNRSWIRFGGIGIQPGEIGKTLLIFTLARHLSVLRTRINAPLSVLQLCIHVALPAGLVYVASEDFGMAIMYFLIFFIMLFASGMNLGWLAGMAGTAVTGLFVFWDKLPKYQRDRILVVFDPSINPDKAFQAERGMMAIGSGQLSGQGLLDGRMTQGSLLPAKHTDFIFASAAEELGFIGASAIILILTLIVVRLFVNAARSDNMQSYLLCAGMGGMIMMQTLINVGMCLGIMPVIGLTLPLFSYGGTSLAVTLASLGMAAGVRLRQTPTWLRDRQVM